MHSSATSRHGLQRVFVILLLSACASFGVAQSETAGPQKGSPNGRPGNVQAHSGVKGQNQEHLAQWMDRHSTLPLEQQQRALQNEPGFHDLPAQTQQRMLNHLNQLNNMPPDQRRRLLERNEVMEHLTPGQRQEVRGAMQQLGGLPVDRRRLVARAFRDLREMPQPQRQEILTSERFRGQFSDQERDTLSNLLSVEPYLPVPRSADPSDYGKQ